MRHPRFAIPQLVVRQALLVRLPPVIGRELPIVTKVPNPRPDEFLRLILAGGPRTNLITVSPRIIFEAWSDSSTKAAQLAWDTYAVVCSLEDELVEGVQIGAVETWALPDDLPDETGQARYTFNCSLDMSYTDTI